jgi:hypothetical protein
MIDAYSHLDSAEPDPLTDFKLRMRTAGIDCALVVETWKGDNYSALEAIMASRSPIFRVVPCFRLESRIHLSRLISHPMVAGIRVRTADLRHLEELTGLLVSSEKWLVPHADSGIAPLASELLKLVRNAPGLRIYLPHCAWPRRDRADDPDWEKSIAELAALPSVVAGVSAISYFSVEAFPHRDVQPFVAKLVKVFGSESIVAASDYPMFEKTAYADYILLARLWIMEQARTWSPHFESMVFSDRQVRSD